MKTTGGKSKVTRRKARPVCIFNESGTLVSTRNASSLKQALLEFYKERLKPIGYNEVQVVGNVLSVARCLPQLTRLTFVAKDPPSLETRGLNLNRKEGMTEEQWEELKAQVEAHGPSAIVFREEHMEDASVEDVVYDGEKIVITIGPA